MTKTGLTAHFRARAYLAFVGAILFSSPVLAQTAEDPSASGFRVQGPRPVDPRLRAQPVDPRLRNQPTVAATVETQPGEPVDAPAAVRPAAAAPTGRIGTPVPGQSGTPLRPGAIPASVEPEAPVAPPTLRTPSYLVPQGMPTASGPSALDLMKQCFAGAVGTVADPSCVGYVSGYVGAIRMAASVADGFPICLPQVGIPNEAIVHDVSTYLEDNPDALQKSARSIVFLVLSQKYPCNGGTQ